MAMLSCSPQHRVAPNEYTHGHLQIQIYLPDPANAAAGVVRTIIKDNDDSPIYYNVSFVFLDSDGLVNANQSRVSQVSPLLGADVLIMRLLQASDQQAVMAAALPLHSNQSQLAAWSAYSGLPE